MELNDETLVKKTKKIKIKIEITVFPTATVEVAVGSFCPLHCQLFIETIIPVTTTTKKMKSEIVSLPPCLSSA